MFAVGFEDRAALPVRRVGIVAPKSNQAGVGMEPAAFFARTEVLHGADGSRHCGKQPGVCMGIIPNVCACAATAGHAFIGVEPTVSPPLARAGSQGRDRGVQAVEQPARKGAVVVRIPPEASLAGQTIVLVQDVTGNRLRVLKTNSVGITLSRIRKMPRQKERDRVLFARRERHFRRPQSADEFATQRDRAFPFLNEVFCRTGGRGIAARRYFRRRAGQHHCAEVRGLSQGRNSAGARFVTEFDLIDEHVAPAAAGIVDNLDASAPSFERLHRPTDPAELLRVAAPGRTDGLAIDNQRDAGLVRVPTAAHFQVDESTVDGERPRRHLAFRHIAAQVTVDQPFALEVGNRLLVCEGPAGRCGAERFAFDSPNVIVAAFEILEYDRRPWLRAALQSIFVFLSTMQDETTIVCLNNLGCSLPDDLAPRAVANGVLQPAEHARMQLSVRAVLHRDMKQRCRKAGVLRVQGNER